jgi:hypothetical protein
MEATTPADLGVRATLLIDKHAEYIKSFSKLWDVSISKLSICDMILNHA